MLSSSTVAHALQIRIAPLVPLVVGEPASFRVVEVLDAAPGPVEFTWKFGNGVTAAPTTELTIPFTYEGVGRFPIIVLARDSAGTRTSATGLQVVHHPITATKPSHSTTILFDEARSRVWNLNPDHGSVTVSDASGAALTKLNEVPSGKRPRSIAQAPDGSLWVTNQESSDIAIFDPDTAQEIGRIALPYAAQPHGIAFGPDGLAYVSLFALGKVVAIDAATRAVVAEAEPGPTPSGIAVSHDGRVFVTRFISAPEHGEIYELAAGTLAPVRTIELPFDPGPDTESAGRGVPNYVVQMVISPDGTQAWVAAKKDNIARGPMRDGLPMNSDSFVRAIICVIDLASSTERLDARMDIDNRSLPRAFAFSALGDYAFVAAMASNWIGFQDAYAAQNVSGIKGAGLAPDGLALSSDGRLFVHAFLSRTVLQYDVSLALDGTDSQFAEPSAVVNTVAEEVLSAQVLQGKRVFFDAADTRMSDDGYMACVSCHFEGFHDGRVWDFTDRGEGLRNTKSLLGIRGAKGQGPVHWSANFNEIQDFERDIRESLDGSGFMPDAEWAMRAPDPFGLPTAGVSPELDALAAYIESLAMPASPHRNEDGTYTEAAKCGRQVFVATGCTACHAGDEMTDSDSPESLHDVGTLLPTSGKRLNGELLGIDTPSLRGIWQTAPYLHDGRAPTVLSVLREYNPHHVQLTANLSDAQLSELVTYLEQNDGIPAPDGMSWEPVEACAPALTHDAGLADAGHADAAPADVTMNHSVQNDAAGCAVRADHASSQRSTFAPAWLALCWLVLRRRRSAVFSHSHVIDRCPS